MNKSVKTKKYKIKYQNVIIFISIIYILFFILNNFLNMKITNIYIVNNSFLTDQKIIEMAEIDNYPSTFKNSSKKIKNKLENNIYIDSAHVYKKNLTQIYIEIDENRPLFYRSSIGKTILLDGSEVDSNLNVPTLVNYIPDTIYDKFIEKMLNVDIDILKRISEIEYNPNKVDDERFLLTMIDGNYVYLTLYKFDSINKYIDIVKNFENEKGIIYLDSGEYFKVVE